MNGNDGRKPPEWPIDPKTGRREPAPAHSRDAAPAPGRKRTFSPILLALGGLLVLLLLLWLFTGNRSADQDKLTGAETNEASTANPEKRCASKRTYELIKQELFRRAAQVRGSDQAAFDKLSAYAVLRMENPVLESENSDTGAANCSGSLSLDLPPGVAVVGGRRTLTSDVDYTLQRAADGSGDVVLLRNADAIVTPLATLARVSDTASPAEPQTPDPLAPMDDIGGAGAPGDTGSQAQPPDPMGAEPAPPPERTTASPSFNCGAARTRGEIAVCSDSGLASLDRQMASRFNRAMSEASPDERALLQRTRNRFLSYRDSCRTDSCVADSYRGRIREIGDIMAGRWQPR